MSAPRRVPGAARCWAWISMGLPAWVLAACTAAALGCGRRGGTGSSPQLRIVQVSDLGTIPTNPDILGRDGVYSGVFQGRSVWLHGDTILARPDASGRSLISNSWSSTSDLDAADGIGGFEERLDGVGAPTMLIQETPDEQAFNAAHQGDHCQVQPCGSRWAIWPSSIVADPTGDRAFVFYMVESVDPYGNFQGLGSSVATWDSLDQLPQRPSLSPAPVPGHPDLMFDQTEPNFGSTAMIRDGLLYVYGCGVDTDGLDKGCRLARVAPSSVQDRGAWRFFAGSGRWSSSIGDAVPVFDGLDILSVSWNAHLQQYVAIYSALFSLNVMVRTAPSPEGPWSDEEKVFAAMPPAGSSDDVYDAHAHAEFDGDGGRTIYVSYSRATGWFSSEVRLVAVQLEPRDGT